MLKWILTILCSLTSCWQPSKPTTSNIPLDKINFNHSQGAYYYKDSLLLDCEHYIAGHKIHEINRQIEAEIKEYAQKTDLHEACAFINWLNIRENQKDSPLNFYENTDCLNKLFQEQAILASTLDKKTLFQLIQPFVRQGGSKLITFKDIQRIQQDFEHSLKNEKSLGLQCILNEELTVLHQISSELSHPNKLFIFVPPSGYPWRKKNSLSHDFYQCTLKQTPNDIVQIELKYMNPWSLFYTKKTL